MKKWAKQMLLVGRENLTYKKGWGEALDTWSKSKVEEMNMQHVTIVGQNTYSLLISKAMNYCNRAHTHIPWSQTKTRSHTHSYYR
jgi:hypothetical protein